MPGCYIELLNYYLKLRDDIIKKNSRIKYNNNYVLVVSIKHGRYDTKASYISGD